MQIPERGQFPDDLEIDRDRTFEGALTGAVTVRTGCSLVVRGHFEGDLTLEPDAMVTIYGTAYGRVQSNEGLILLAGHTSWDPSSVPGNFAVCVGTIFATADGNQRVLTANGSLKAITEASVSIEIEAGHTDSYFYFDRPSSTFRLTSELE